MDYSKAYKGIFKPKHPHKYKGDPTNIIYRSSWEKQCMIYFDNKPDIVQWQSEALTGINNPYQPYKQTQEPKIQKKKTRRYLTEVKTFAINTYKWKAAREYCAARKWEFVILTEKELKI